MHRPILPASFLSALDIQVHWCPDRMSRDHFTRMRDDSRYAVLKPAVVKLVMAAFGPEAPPAGLAFGSWAPTETKGCHQGQLIGQFSPQ